MRIQSITILILFFLLSWLGTPVKASGTSAPSNVTTVTAEKSLLEKLSEYGTLDYFGTYRGSSLSRMDSTLQPGVNGALDPTSPAMLDNSITAGYKINKDWIVGGVGHFYLFPWSDPNGGGQKLQLLDPTLFVSRPELINDRGFKLDTRLTFFLPMSKYDTLVSNGLATAITAVFNARHEALMSNLTVGVYSYVRAYIPTSDTHANAPSNTVVAAPYGSFQVNDRLAVTLLVDLLSVTRNYGTGFFSGLKTGVVDIEPGISWDITKNITINPFLNIYPSNPTLASTSIQASIIAKAF
jgi:hypothetical protein